MGELDQLIYQPKEKQRNGKTVVCSYTVMRKA